MSTELLLVQVAAAAHGAWPIVDGTADPEPDAVALDDATRLGNRLAAHGVDAVLTAPSRRGVATATRLAAPFGIDVEVVDGLREIHHGEYEGKPFPELRAAADPVFADFVASRSWGVFPGGEDCASALVRIRAVLDAITGRFGDATVVAVTHGGIINLIVADLLDIDQEVFFMPASTSVSGVLLGAGRPTLLVLNDSRHAADPLLSSTIPVIHETGE